jgi:hypothetical protein
MIKRHRPQFLSPVIREPLGEFFMCNIATPGFSLEID